MSRDDDRDEAYALEHFSDTALAERRADCERQSQWEHERDLAEKAAERVYFARNPWPTDPTALHGSRMGLQEWIRERGD